MASILQTPPKISPFSLSLTTTLLLFLSLSSLTTISSFVPYTPVGPCHPNDKKALLQIKAHYPKARYFSFWNPKSDCCSDWDVNIVCNAAGRVTSFLVAFDADVTGSIPPEVGDLPYLTSLSFYQNRLTGPLPSTLTKLTNLEELVLNGNGLTGPVPSFLGQLKSLKSLDLSDNKFTGDASFLFGKDKAALESVDISQNALEFDFSNVELPKSLRTLKIAHNKIYGSVPKNLGQLPFEELDVSYNQLCGKIPTGRRINQMSPTVFAHNKCLCGRPLPPCK